MVINRFGGLSIRTRMQDLVISSSVVFLCVIGAYHVLKVPGAKSKKRNAAHPTKDKVA